MNVSEVDIYDILPAEILQNAKSLCAWLSVQLCALWNIILPALYSSHTLQ